MLRHRLNFKRFRAVLTRTAGGTSTFTERHQLVYRSLMIMKMEPADAEAIARIFADHDTTDLPRQIGASSRTLFRFHDLYLHLIEADRDIMGNLYAARNHPIFRDTNDRLRKLLTPYSQDWRELKDSSAEVFYNCRWDGK